MQRAEDFMREALRLAREAAARGDDPYGAVLVKDGEIVSRGQNRIHSRHDPTCHSEIDAIRQYCAAHQTADLSDCTLYTSCEPCFMCSACIVRVRLGKLVYSAGEADSAALDGKEIYDTCELIFRHSAYAPEVEAGFLREEGLQVLRECHQAK